MWSNFYTARTFFFLRQIGRKCLSPTCSGLRLGKYSLNSQECLSQGWGTRSWWEGKRSHCRRARAEYPLPTRNPGRLAWSGKAVHRPSTGGLLGRGWQAVSRANGSLYSCTEAQRTKTTCGPAQEGVWGLPRSSLPAWFLHPAIILCFAQKASGQCL